MRSVAWKKFEVRNFKQIPFRTTKTQRFVHEFVIHA